jgi:hypothetical protein
VGFSGKGRSDSGCLRVNPGPCPVEAHIHRERREKIRMGASWSALRTSSHTEPLIASQLHRGHDVLSSPCNDDQRRLLKGVEVEGLPSLIIAVLAGRIGATPQACSELFDCRSIYCCHPNLRSSARTRRGRLTKSRPKCIPPGDESARIRTIRTRTTPVGMGFKPAPVRVFRIRAFPVGGCRHPPTHRTPARNSSNLRAYSGCL